VQGGTVVLSNQWVLYGQKAVRSQIWATRDLRELEGAASTFYVIEGRYPASLSELASKEPSRRQCSSLMYLNEVDSARWPFRLECIEGQENVARLTYWGEDHKWNTEDDTCRIVRPQ
jgi:hypothetical protein